MAGQSFQEVFEALKPIFEEYAGKLGVQADKPGQYYLETKSAIRQGQRLHSAGGVGVRVGSAVLCDSRFYHVRARVYEERP